MGLDAKTIIRTAEDRIAYLRQKKNQQGAVMHAIANLYRRVRESTKITRQGQHDALDPHKPADLCRMLTMISDFISDTKYAKETVRKLRPVGTAGSGLAGVGSGAAAAAAGAAGAGVSDYPSLPPRAARDGIPRVDVSGGGSGGGGSGTGRESGLFVRQT